MAIMYICDQKKYCNASALCGIDCKHTADRKHALYRNHKWFTKIGENSWEQEQENEDGSSEPME